MGKWDIFSGGKIVEYLKKKKCEFIILLQLKTVSRNIFLFQYARFVLIFSFHMLVANFVANFKSKDASSAQINYDELFDLLKRVLDLFGVLIRLLKYIGTMNDK